MGMKLHQDRGRTLRWRTRELLLVSATAVLSACNPGADEARALGDSCASGDAAACNDLGYQVAQGQHVLRDWRRAAGFFEAACDGGAAEGCVRLGRMHVHDDGEARGVARDSAIAATLLQRGCDGGAMNGCSDLADMYLDDDSIVADVEPRG